MFLKSLFGNIKQNLKFREFLTRGTEKVRIEHNLVCTAHNLKITWGKLAGKVDVLSKINDFVANLVSAVTTSIFRFSFLLSRGVS